MFNFLSVKVELGILPVDYGVDGGVEEREQFGHLREVEECGAELEKQKCLFELGSMHVHVGPECLWQNISVHYRMDEIRVPNAPLDV